MDSDKVSGVMLVINELLSNSIEHGFNHKTEGNIEITINNNDPFSIFTIKDNGCGFSKGSNFESLGLNIVKAIIKDKLSGKLQIHTDDSGTKIEFSVKN